MWEFVDFLYTSTWKKFNCENLRNYEVANVIVFWKRSNSRLGNSEAVKHQNRGGLIKDKVNTGDNDFGVETSRST